MGKQATITADCLARDEGGIVRSKECGQTGNVLRTPVSPQQQVPLGHFGKVGHFQFNFGVTDQTRQDRAAANAVATMLYRAMYLVIIRIAPFDEP